MLRGLGRPILPRPGAAAAAIAGTGAFGLLAVGVVLLFVLPPRAYVLVLLLALGMTLGRRGEPAAIIALLGLPVIACIRRLSAGPSGYVYNDPLALAVAVLLIPAALWFLIASGRQRVGAVSTSSEGESSPATSRLLALLCTWLVLCSSLGLTSQPAGSILYGLATQLLPLVVAVQVSSGRFSGISIALTKGLPLVAVAAAVYAIVQWVAPLPWDLAWLTTQQSSLVSVGRAVPGQFRIFATAESPGAAALVFGTALVVLVPKMLRRSSLTVEARALIFCAVCLCGFALSLTAVRAALFAVPLTLVIILLVDSRVPRLVVLPVAALLIAASILVPTALATNNNGAQRYDIATLNDDQSFQDRSALLPQFAETIVTAPLGRGAGSSGLAQRLDSGVSTGPTANIDNGYLSRLVETGVPGLALFIALCALVLAQSISRIRRGRSSPDDILMLSIVILFLLEDFSGPTTSSLAGLYFWIALGRLAWNARVAQSPPDLSRPLATRPTDARRFP